MTINFLEFVLLLFLRKSYLWKAILQVNRFAIVVNSILFELYLTFPLFLWDLFLKLEQFYLAVSKSSKPQTFSCWRMENNHFVKTNIKTKLKFWNVNVIPRQDCHRLSISGQHFELFKNKNCLFFCFNLYYTIDFKHYPKAHLKHMLIYYFSIWSTRS